MIFWMFAVLVLSLMVLYPPVRRFAVGGLALVLVLGATIYGLDIIQDRQAASRVLPEQVGLVGFEVGAVGGSFQLNGRIRNDSGEFQIESLELEVTAQDCSAGGTDCVGISQSREWLSLAVPPGQARDFSRRLDYRHRNLTPRGELVWRYKVLETRAVPVQ